MSDFTPTELSVDEQRTIISGRIKQLEQERLFAGLELEGTHDVTAAPEREQAIAQDTASFTYSVELLDAKLKVYREALSKLDGLAVAPAAE